MVAYTSVIACTLLRYTTHRVHRIEFTKQVSVGEQGPTFLSFKLPLPRAE